MSATVPDYYSDERVTLYHGDCLDVLRTLPDASVDSVVTDPPYGLEFMGKEWDRFGATVEATTDTRNRDGNWTTPPFGGGGQRVRYGVAPGKPFQDWCTEWATECLRVLKPGGHMLAFGGTRTWHRLACAVEDAGFEVRDSIAWLYGSGFPKSLDVSKAIDKMDATHERRARALRFTAWMRSTGITARQVDEATETNMGGHYLTAESQPAVATVAHLDMLRPLLPEVPEWVEEMARQRTVESQNFASREVTGIGGKSGKARNSMAGDFAGEWDITAPATPDAERWQGWGTALKPAFEPVVVARKPLTGTVARNVLQYGTGALNIDATRVGDSGGTTKGNPPKGESNGIYGNGINGACDIVDLGKGRWPANVVLDDSQAAVLDEQSGTSTSRRSAGRNGTDAAESTWGLNRSEDRERGHNDSGGASRFFPTFRYVAKAPKRERPRGDDGTAHPTVKPLDLMRWLVRLVTPPDGTVLEPFAGSGTTVEACIVEGFRCIAIEKTDEYLPLIMQRVQRRDPVAYIETAGDDLGLFGIGELA